MMKKRIKFAIKSLKGRRKANQDALACAYNKANDFIAIVCDGVGSIQHSEHASQITVDTFCDEFIKTNKILNISEWFRQTLDLALRKMTEYAKKHNCKEISTTLAVLVIVNDKFYTYNIGDTRIYIAEKTKDKWALKQYSYDHNYRNYLLAKKASKSVLEANKHRWGALTNLLDASNHASAKFDANSGTIDSAKHILICTDGLYSYVTNELITKVITTKFPTPAKLTKLNMKAFSSGSNDNISGILVSVK